MDKKEVLKRCSDAGFLLDREILEFFLSLDEEFFVKSLELVKISGISEKILTKKLFDKKISGKLNVFSGKLNNSVKILKNFDKKGGKVLNGDFVSYFRRRFEVIRDRLLERGVDNLISIRRLGTSNGVYSIIGMIYDKRITKNRNLLLEVEDLGGRTVVLVNRENRDLFERASRLVEDDILVMRCSGSAKMLFLSDFDFVGFERKERFGDEDAYVGFVSDFHVGNRDFLEDDLRRMVDWVNGEVGDARSQEIAKKLKYLVVVGDLVEGVGVYPGQEKEVLMRSVRAQYNKLAEILGKIRGDVEIVVLPGLHDAVWLGEPQPALSEKWIGDLGRLPNLRFVSNPCVLEIGGLRFLLNYGINMKGFVSKLGVKDFGVCDLGEVLRRGFLPLVYGESDFVPVSGDDLVLDREVDVFVVGGFHRAEVGELGGVLGVLTSCWKGVSDFERRRGMNVDNSRVPILNLKSREVKILDFGEKEIVWEVGEDLVCRLNEYKSARVQECVSIPHKSEESATHSSSCGNLDINRKERGGKYGD